MNNNRRLYGLEVGCPQMTLSINDQQNNIFVNRGTILTFKVCGSPNADYIIQNVGSNSDSVYVNDFYPYNVVDKGQLNSDGIFVFSMPLNKVGTFVFRAGQWCTIGDIDYCSSVSNTVTITVLYAGCISNYVCRQPLDGYEYDANHCGQVDRVNNRCKPECGGVGCDGEDGITSKDNLLKIGIVVAVIGGALYLSQKK